MNYQLSPETLAQVGRVQNKYKIRNGTNLRFRVLEKQEPCYKQHHQIFLALFAIPELRPILKDILLGKYRFNPSLVSDVLNIFELEDQFQSDEQYFQAWQWQYMCEVLEALDVSS